MIVDGGELPVFTADEKSFSPIPLRRQSLSTMLRRSAERHGDKLALICGDVSLSYVQLDRATDRLCNGLFGAGIAKGDRVAVMARNSHAFVILRFAVARAGAVLVPINFMLNAEDARYILDHAGARLLFVDANTVEVGEAARPATVEAVFGLPGEDKDAPLGVPGWDELFGDEVRPEEVADAGDLLQIIYTSGTESRPKGAMLTHDAVLWQYQSCVIDCEWTAQTVALHALPLYHCAQLDAMLGPALQVGATNIVTANPAPDNLLGLLSHHRITSFFAPPTVWIGVLGAPDFAERDLGALTHGYYGASIMPGEVLREMVRRLPRLRLWNLYGQTEIAPVATVLFPEEQAARPASCGRPALHVSTRVVDDALTDVAPGEIGEIVHRSPHLMQGYWRDPARTAEAFAGGWFHSGDLGRIDAEGYITVVDRKKDMIKTGGENVSSREVEEVLHTHAAVQEVAVVGIPHPKWIEMVTAFVVLRAGERVTDEELRSYCLERLSAYKAPKKFVFTDALPRNPSGKILKRELRDMP